MTRITQGTLQLTTVLFATSSLMSCSLESNAVHGAAKGVRLRWEPTVTTLNMTDEQPAVARELIAWFLQDAATVLPPTSQRLASWSQDCETQFRDLVNHPLSHLERFHLQWDLINELPTNGPISHYYTDPRNLRDTQHIIFDGIESQSALLHLFREPALGTLLIANRLARAVAASCGAINATDASPAAIYGQLAIYGAEVENALVLQMGGTTGIKKGSTLAEWLDFHQSLQPERNLPMTPAIAYQIEGFDYHRINAIREFHKEGDQLSIDYATSPKETVKKIEIHLRKRTQFITEISSALRDQSVQIITAPTSPVAKARLSYLMTEIGSLHTMSMDVGPGYGIPEVEHLHSQFRAENNTLFWIVGLGMPARKSLEHQKQLTPGYWKQPIENQCEELATADMLAWVESHGDPDVDKSHMGEFLRLESCN